MDHSVTRRKACRLAISAAGATLAAVVLPACSNSTSGMSGKARLNVGVRSDIVGFSERNPNNGKYYGFEIDLANELANRLGYGGCSFTSVTPETREEMLSSGKVDCLIACYSISDERKKLFDFSAAYYTDSVILVVENTSLIQSFSQLKGGTIGTVSGTNAAPQLAAKFLELGLSDGIPRQQDAKSGNVDYDTWHLSQYASYAELSCALEAGDVDAMATDGAIAKTYLDGERTVLPDFGINPQRYAVATQKGSELSPKVAAEVRSMLKDKTIDTLIEKWN